MTAAIDEAVLRRISALIVLTLIKKSATLIAASVMLTRLCCHLIVNTFIVGKQLFSSVVMSHGAVLVHVTPAMPKIKLKQNKYFKEMTQATS